MEKNMFNCCQPTEDLSAIFDNQPCPPTPPCCNPVNRNLNVLSENLCDMRVELAQAKSNLIFLTQVLCSNGCMDETVKLLILSLDKEIKSLNENVAESRCAVEELNCILR